ncbi:MAG TPA: tripartite tricarboxylate transporter substrate binding protein [Burkholderiales bacterium]|nr:tripartite tricarboxylate transporter substrate binding protein [Burkholderiales bacterium]
MKRVFLRGVFVAAGIFMAGFGSAQPYPDRPIRFIVPFAPGGTNDIVARLSGAKLAEKLNQSVVVDNRGGANAVIGTEMAARALPDGYTLLMVNINFAINPAMMGKLPYDALRDFAPISLLATSPTVLVVHPSLLVTSVGELIAYVKANAGKVNYSTSGSGSSTHIPMELLISLTGMQMMPIHYKGGGPALIDLLAGRVPLGFTTILSVQQHLKSSRLRALAVSSARRSPTLPNLATIAESGVPGYEFVGWWGVVAPAKTPAVIVNRLNAEFVKIQREPYMTEHLGQEGAEPRTATPEEFARFLRDETAKWTKVARANNLRPE